VRIVPLVCPLVSICVLLDCVEFSGYNLPKSGDSHRGGAQPRDVQRCRLVVVVSEPVRRVVETAFKAKALRVLVHFLQKVENLRIVSELGLFHHVGTFPYRWDTVLLGAWLRQPL